MSFESNFVTKYQSAFEYMISLGQTAGDNLVNGEEADAEISKGQRLLIVLSALDCSDLTDKEIEALEYCLIELNEDLAIATVQPVYLYSAKESNGFFVGSEDDIGDLIGTEDDISESIPELTIDTPIIP